MRRGRILQTLAAQNAEPRGDSPAARPAADEPCNPAPSQPGRAGRSRGAHVLAQMMARTTISSQQLASEPPPPAAAASQPPPELDDDRQSSTSRSDSASSRDVLRRQRSDLSSSSVVSQQFVPVQQTSYRANTEMKSRLGTGNPIRVSLNYMTFNVDPNKTIEEYHVEFNPNIESIRLRYAVLRSDQARQAIGSVIHWTGTNLYLPMKLDNQVTIFETTHPVNGEAMKVRLTHVKSPPDSELLQFYNSLMHKVMTKLRYVVINRQHYSPLHKIAIDQFRLEVWPGWITSIQRLDAGLMLNVDASFRVLRLETVRDIMLEVSRRHHGGNLREALQSELVGTIVMTRYNNKTYRIDEIDLTKKPTDTFVMSRGNGQEISYIDYMRNQWSIGITDPNQPMIIHRPKPRRNQEAPEIVYLIPELCVTTGLTAEMRSNFNIVKAIGDHTRLPPDVRETKLKEFLHQLATDDRATTILSDWNLSISSELDIVDAKRLDSETVGFGDNRSCKVQDNADWTQAATTSAVVKPVNVENWVLIVTDRDQAIAKELLSCIREVTRNLKINYSPPRVHTLNNDSATSYVNCARREVRRTDQLVVLMTPGKSQREDRYSAIKRLFSCDMPIPCQFIRCGTVSNPRKIRSICQKIVLQINCKLGGQLWAMRFPMKSFMVVGIDTYHDTIDRKRSCVGFVASMNEFTSSWWSRTFFQHSLEEIGQKLQSCLTAALSRFHTLNGFVPDRVIIYRDGVGDGQLDAVSDFEIPQMMNGIQFYMRDNHDAQQLPSVSYIIVQKRISTKLSLRMGNRVMNPQPGSFIDHTITHPDYNDFYLVSQHVNQGTVSPTKYIVLTETGTLGLTHHQKLAYKMTHMYYNWCGTIRVPAPCQYAHKLAYLTGENIRQQASELLEDKLYYL